MTECLARVVPGVEHRTRGVADLDALTAAQDGAVTGGGIVVQNDPRLPGVDRQTRMVLWRDVFGGEQESPRGYLHIDRR